MNKYFVFLVLLIIPFGSFSQENLSLEQAINYSLQNNNTFKNAKLDAEIQRKFANEIMTEGMPKIKMGLDYTYNFQQQKSIIPAGIFGPNEVQVTFVMPHSATLKGELEQLIFDARYFYGLQARKTLLIMAEEKVENERINTADVVSKAYYAALISNEAYKLLLSNKQNLEKILHDTKAIYNEGLVDELSVDRLELNMLTLENQIDKQKNQAENALLNLKYVLGMPNSTDIELTESLESLEQAFDWNIGAQIDASSRIEYDLLQHQAIMKGYDIKQSRSNYFPSLYAWGSYGTLAQRDKFSFFNTNLNWFSFGAVGFRLNIPVFDGGKAHSQVQQRKLELEKINNNLKNFEESMVLQVTNAQNNLANAINDYNNQKENLALAEKILTKTTIMFNEGVGTSFELSQAQQSYTSTQIAYSQSIYNLLIARLDLNKTLGQI